ncbi:Sapep family Mn(2+)-dependent dipeptidase [Acetonema longum]|uniref:Putative peptidase n=1 Tax=Acetonema longum DSM 6540 TaxID=1009370 RepID=F7NGA0_9FIRM|nr:Sapep family Mn(2+)-dependent dipeptidase [Acetonema longum]EGO65018.1 putative peptidase [Acetonema longum DSM 6540]
MLNFAAEAEKYRQEFVALLDQWIRIPSVYSDAAAPAGMPFGREVAQAMEWFISQGREAGFATKAVDGYAAHVEYGSGGEYVCAFGHCDVVPAGGGWSGDPFRLAKQGDRLIGRGVIDDKGPLLAAFLALKIIRDQGLPLKRRIRIVAGGDEESGFRCIRHYFQREPKPAYGFTPDAKFPVINGEKGGLTLEISGGVADSGLLIRGGEVHNTIPGSVTVMNCSADPAMLEQFVKAENLNLEYIRDENTVRGFRLIGQGGHSSKPEQANNPVEKVFRLLASVGEAGRLKDLVPLFGGDNRDGMLFGLDQQGRCGSLTLVPTILRLEGGRLNLTLSIRYPENTGMAEILEKMRRYFNHHGLAGYSITAGNNKRPHYVEADSSWVKKLYNVYVKHTGDTRHPIRVTSAGTYAAEMGNAVVFGGEFPDGSAGNAHMAGEYGSEAAFIKAIGIYAEALWELGNL